MHGGPGWPHQHRTAVLAAGNARRHVVSQEAPGADRQSYQISLIIIHMKTEGPQMKGIIIRCLKCNEVVYRLDRDIFKGPDHQHYGELANIRFYADAAEHFDTTARVCPSCDTVSPSFRWS